MARPCDPGTTQLSVPAQEQGESSRGDALRVTHTTMPGVSQDDLGVLSLLGDLRVSVGTPAWFPSVYSALGSTMLHPHGYSESYPQRDSFWKASAPRPKSI